VTDVSVTESNEILITVVGIDSVKLIQEALFDVHLFFDFLLGNLLLSPEIYSSSERSKVSIKAFLSADGVCGVEDINRFHVHLVSVYCNLVNKWYFDWLVHLQVWQEVLSMTCAKGRLG
jgi:hypothetical protein